jgi:hypothetical protein
LMAALPMPGLRERGRDGAASGGGQARWPAPLGLRDSGPSGPAVILALRRSAR